MFALVTSVIMIVAFVVGAQLGKANRTKKPSARELALGQTIRKIRDEAVAYRETDAGLSFAITDIIRDDLEKKELL